MSEMSEMSEASHMTAVPSPLHPRSLLQLYLFPSRFFSGRVSRGGRPYLLAAAFLCGMAATLGRVEKQMVKADLGTRASGIESIGILDSWFTLWVLVLCIGVIGAGFMWVIGGWWYKIRVAWSGATTPDPFKARVIYVYVTLVWALPVVLIYLAATGLYPSFREYWYAEEYWSSSALAFMFWSCVTSYKAVRASFPVSKWKARVWFLLLPGLLYSVGLGALIVAYALAASG